MTTSTSRSREITGCELRAMREKAGFSLRGLAAHSGFSMSYLSRVENGLRAVTPTVVRLYSTLPSAACGRVGDRTPAAPEPRERPEADLGLGITWFGAEVRRLRMAREESLEGLGAEVYLSRAYLGKIEQGRARGTYQIALALDTALGAQGRLAKLFLEECARVGPVPPDVEILTADERVRAPMADDPCELAVSAAFRLELLRIRSHRHGPFSVLRELSEGVVELHDIAVASGAASAEPAWSVAIRYAELLGWMAQETGHDAKALRWTLAASQWAHAIGDMDSVAYALIRQSQWARRRGEASAAVRYARAAGTVPHTSQRIKKFAAQREAQACALAGDEPSFREALDCFHGLGGESEGDSPDDAIRPQWGPQPDPAFENTPVFEATCLVDLGDFNTAATLFADHMDGLRSARTGYARLAVREALAYAHVGEPELACGVVVQALPTVARQGSASLREDLKRLTHTLNRHRRNGVVRELLPDLARLASAVSAGTSPAAHRP